MKSYITGSKSPPILTDKNTSTASTVPYFIVFLETNQCVLCGIPDTRARLCTTECNRKYRTMPRHLKNVI